MKKQIIFLIMAFLVLPSVLAINLDVETTGSNHVLIVDLDEPAVFDLEITNNGASDSFSFYNLLGFEMFPIGTVQINSGQTKDVELKLKPIEGLEQRGPYKFNYFISASDGSEQKEELLFRIIELKDAFDVGAEDIDPNSNTLKAYIKNTRNFNFDSVSAEFSSNFFEFEKSFSLEPYEKKEFEVHLNKDDFKEIIAGFYTIQVKVNVNDQEADVEGTIKFNEEEMLVTKKESHGFFINTKIIEKINDGNVIAQPEVIIKKNVISRLFTSVSPQPDLVEREGLVIYYIWNSEIKPGESLKISVRTNWLLPLFIILLVVAIVILVKQYSGRNLVLKKKVSFVRTKGGEFGLKVSIFVNAKKYIERVNILDRIPQLVKLYRRFGGEEPTRVDEENRKIEWNFEKLEQGEIRVLSYIVYSKIGVLGRFALPSARAVYERDGDIHETNSNKAFFITQQGREKSED